MANVFRLPFASQVQNPKGNCEVEQDENYGKTKSSTESNEFLATETKNRSTDYHLVNFDSTSSLSFLPVIISLWFNAEYVFAKLHSQQPINATNTNIVTIKSNKDCDDYISDEKDSVNKRMS